MVLGRVSVIIPSRVDRLPEELETPPLERFAIKTIGDVLAKAAGDVEVVVVFDGYWPRPDLYTVLGLPNNDPRIIVCHNDPHEGMRLAINGAVEMATGEYLMKVDDHCLLAEGFDEVLKADYHEHNWVLVPRRYALDPEAWGLDSSNPKYPVDYHYLSYPYERLDDPKCGLHGDPWRQRRDARKDVLLDEEMSSQGSCWFMHRSHWGRIGPMDYDNYGTFINEFQEVGLKTWLGGGAVMVTKRTFYAHLYKGKKWGRGYSMRDVNHQAGACYAIDYWMHNDWSERVHDLSWLIERFWPVPTWPTKPDGSFDVEEAFKPRRGLAAARFANSAPDGKKPA